MKEYKPELWVEEMQAQYGSLEQPSMLKQVDAENSFSTKEDMISKDIFELKGDDIPPELEKELEYTILEKASSLFDFKDTLTAREILIGLYNQYNIITTRAEISLLINSLIIIERISPIGTHGIYGVVRR